MKIRFNYKHSLILLGVAGMMLASCKHYLDLQPISSFGTEYTFSNVSNVKKAVLGVYEDLTGDQGYGIRVSMYFPYDQDAMMGAPGDKDNDRRDIGRYNLTAGNQQLARPFNQMYEGIERANQCIKYIPQMDLYQNGSAQDKGELRRLYGEALTLRAQFYFELVRNWGDLPAEWAPSADQADLFLPKTDRDTIYDHILNDLQTAEALVPWRTELGSIGDTYDERITKGAVKGLRARIALFRGGYSLRRSGQMERSSDYMKFYQIADTECLSIIQRPDEHALDPSYEDLWKNQVDAHQMDPYGEVMFQVAMSGGTGHTDSKLGYFNGPRYDGKGNSSLRILPTYFYAFDSVDTRRDVTVAPYNVNKDGTLDVQNLGSLFDGKFRHDWISINGTLIGESSAQYFGINWPILRFSDVLLMYAEAENEINGGPTGGAVQAYESVRKRAFAGHEDQIGTTPTDKDGFFNAIVKERKLEFGSEAIRKYDLIRWNLLGDKIAEAKAALQAIANRQPPYDNLPTTMYYKTNSTKLVWGNSLYQPSPTSAPDGYTGVDWVGSSSIMNTFDVFAEGFKKNHSELFPIPQSSIDANPNLTQDYGY